MKKILPILILAAALTGCFSHERENCPNEVCLTFALDDEHEPGDFDSRIGNDVTLYIYKNKAFYQKMVVPYGEISGGRKYYFPKPDDFFGQIDIVAWSASATECGAGVGVPDHNDTPVDQHIAQTVAKENEEGCDPLDNGLYIGVVSFNDPVDVFTERRVGMLPGGCRIEVNVTDATELLSAPRAIPRTTTHGIMDKMNLELKGTGAPTLVHAPLVASQDDPLRFSTGRYIVMPSGEDQTVSVRIYNAREHIITLKAPKDALPQGATVGGLIVFDYVLGETFFHITVDGFTRKVFTVDEI